MTPWKRALGMSAVVPLFIVVGCSGYLGSARDFNPAELDRESGWIAVRTVPPIRQQAEEDCGVAAIAMVMAYWKHPVSRQEILEACPVKPGEGIRAADLRDFAKRFGLVAHLIHGEWPDFQIELTQDHPVLVGLIKPYASGNVSHYEVVVGIRPDSQEVVTLDPAQGWRINTAEGFLREWTPAGRLTLVVFRNPADLPEATGER